MTSLRAILRDLATGISRWCFNPRCPLCPKRVRDIEAHFAQEHRR